MKSSAKKRYNPNLWTFIWNFRNHPVNKYVWVVSNVFTLSPKHVSNKHVSSKQVCNAIFHTSFCLQTSATHWFYNFSVLWHWYQILIIKPRNAFIQWFDPTWQAVFRNLLPLHSRQPGYLQLWGSFNHANSIIQLKSYPSVTCFNRRQTKHVSA